VGRVISEAPGRGAPTMASFINSVASWVLSQC